MEGTVVIKLASYIIRRGAWGLLADTTILAGGAAFLIQMLADRLGVG